MFKIRSFVLSLNVLCIKNQNPNKMNSNKIVLYVDDEPINRTLFHLMFKNDFEVLIAESGMEALDILESNDEIKVVVSDMKMPKMDGMEFIDNAKKINSSAAYFLLSGYILSEEIKKALDKNIIAGYLNKPFNKAKVVELLQAHM